MQGLVALVRTWGFALSEELGRQNNGPAKMS